jgi:hypothetical protein
MTPLRVLLALSLALVAATSCVPAGAAAWGNGGYSSDYDDPDYGIHDWIADEALTMQTANITFLTSTYHSEYLLGTEAPDNPALIGDSINHHVYYYSSGALQDDASAVRAQSLYDLALASLEGGNFSAAAYRIGVMTHYIADLGVFGHTMGADTDWGAEEHHSDYEEAVGEMLGSVSLPSGMELWNMSARDAALGLARNTTFGAGDVRPNVWMDDNYDWANPEFEASAMASLYGSVSAVAAAVNSVLSVSEYEPPPEPAPEPAPEPEPEPEPDTPPEPDEEQETDGEPSLLVPAAVSAAVAALVAGIALALRRGARGRER